MQLVCLLAIILGFTSLVNAGATPVSGAATKVTLCLLCCAAHLGLVWWLSQLRRHLPSTVRPGWVDCGERWAGWAYLVTMALVFTVFDLATIVHTNWHLSAIPWGDQLAVVLTLSVPLMATWAMFAGATPQPTPGTVLVAVEYQTRHLLLLPIVPILALTGISDLLQVWVPADATQLDDGVGAAVMIALAVGFPELLRRCWRTRALRPGPTRDRVLQVLQSSGVTVREILYWNTGGLSTNAAVAGFVPHFRYLFLTDQLLRRLGHESLAVIVAHEAAHCRHQHLPRLAISLAVPLVSGLALSVGFAPSDWRSVLGTPLAALVLLGCWLRYHQRWARAFEHQADLSACRWLSADRRLSATSVDVFRRALLGVDPDPAGDWLHPAPSARIAFLDAAMADPTFAVAFERRLRYWTILQGSFVGLLLLGSWWLA